MVRRVNARFSEVMSSQFRPIEVAALEKRQRQFKKPGLIRLEFEFLPTVRSGAGCFELPLILSIFGLLSQYNPTSTFRTSDARARNAISHFKIILRSRSWISPFSTCLATRFIVPGLESPYTSATCGRYPDQPMTGNRCRLEEKGAV